MNPSPIVLSIPIFFLLIGIELVVERLSNKKLYRLPDAIANMSCGITSQLSGIFLKIIAITCYELLFANFAFFHFTDDDKTWYYWLFLYLFVDHAYYWGHRMSHQVNIMWGGHGVHHQSEDYNLSVALRQSSFEGTWTFAFSLPLALVGFDTMDFAIVSALNTLYQFWIHTETINKLGWFEYVFNTPSHHRVHHGRNPKYIDRNYGGSLIIWDRLYGTYQPEEERPTYGITKPLNSWNAVWANFSHYDTMVKEFKAIPKWKDKLRYIVARPGWLPDYMGGYRPAPEIDKSYHKYETPSSSSLDYYVLAQYVVCLGVTALLLFKQGDLPRYIVFGAAAMISWWVVNCGVLFEKKSWVRPAEWVRLCLFGLLAVVATFTFQWPVYVYYIAVAYLLISAVWFSRTLKYETRLAVQ